MNTHPEKWYIQVTEENMKELNRWRLSVRTESAARHDHQFGPGCYLLSKYPVDGEGSYFYLKTIEPFPSKFPEYKEITLEQFRQITDLTPNPMPKSIQISRQLLNEYYDAATTPQREYLSVHFRLDGTTTEAAIRELHAMACDTWKPRIKKNHPDCFPEDSKRFDFSGYMANNYFNILKAGIGNQLGTGNTFIQTQKVNECKAKSEPSPELFTQEPASVQELTIEVLGQQVLKLTEIITKLVNQTPIQNP